MAKASYFQIVTIERTNPGRHTKKTVWFTGYSDEEFCRFMQYVIDGHEDPGKFLVYSPELKKAYSAMALAENHFHLRKRTREERMADVEYWKDTIRKIRAGKEVRA